MLGSAVSTMVESSTVMKKAEASRVSTSHRRSVAVVFMVVPSGRGVPREGRLTTRSKQRGSTGH